VGGVSLGVETRHEEKASPAQSAVMILGGLNAMAAVKATSTFEEAFIVGTAHTAYCPPDSLKIAKRF
jgi:hypothetical protein